MGSDLQALTVLIEFVLVSILMSVARVWGTETCDEETEASIGNGSAGIDHLQREQLL